MHTANTLTLALATASGALAAPLAARQANEFSLAMALGDGVVALTAVLNGTDIVLEAGRLSVYPGQEAHFIGADAYLAVILDFTNNTGPLAGYTQYGLVVPDVGHVAGAAATVTAVKDYDDFDFTFSVADGVISHKLTATTNTWFACEDTVNGEQNLVLKWGNSKQDGSLPDGCQPATFIQNFNIPGGPSS
ncbi:Uu.00g058370.m01.CDS01 [Anthostomella pinea]|uniref:Uu.00g058370.m01.CDS01 n=1 Tax=Anthostomella pinea TaxID=933095 RepID=A0AAI8VRW2_9PEZI|nr:Uu.00g058370.m01.CDS01 [Anthostomella pinea]